MFRITTSEVYRTIDALLQFLHVTLLMFIEDKNDINAAPSVIFSLYMTQINLWHEGGISVTSHQHPLQSVSLQTPDTELISTQASPLSRYL